MCVQIQQTIKCLEQNNVGVHAIMSGASANSTAICNCCATVNTRKHNGVTVQCVYNVICKKSSADDSALYIDRSPQKSLPQHDSAAGLAVTTVMLLQRQ